MMKVLCFGSLNIDYFYKVNKIVSPGETISSVKLSRSAGGKGLNQSVALAKSGAETYHAGLIGDDGEFLRSFLDENGVDTGYIKTVQSPTGHAVIQVADTGENAIVVYGGANRKIDPEFVTEVFRGFDAGDFVLLQNEISCIPEIIDEAKKKGMFVMFNPSPADEEIRAIDLNKVDCLILNEHEASFFSPDDIEGYMRERYPDLMCILTLGDRGSIYFRGTERYFQSPYKVTVADTTAAGDTFTGYFLGSVSRGVPVVESLKTASAAAAVCVTRAGSAVSIPDLKDVEMMMKGYMQ